MKDKREECGCSPDSRGWPICLTSKEKRQLTKEVSRSILAPDPQGPLIQCAIETCQWESLYSEDFELHEMAPDIWRWICNEDVWLVEEGK